MATATPKTIVAFGELLWDVFPTGEVLGGAPSNFAYRINSFGDRAQIVTRLGRDERGARAADLLKVKGLSLDFVQWDDVRPTGTVPVSVDEKGSPDFRIIPNVAYDFIERTPALIDLAERADALCFGTLIQRRHVSRTTLYAMLEASKGLKVLDLNLRKDCYTEETVNGSLARADILKLNEEEADYLAERHGLSKDRFAMEAIGKWNLRCCVVTLGPKGAVVGSPEGSVTLQTFHAGNSIVDTVGCGDAFTAMFLHKYLRGESIAESCTAANELATKVAYTRGGMEPVTC